MVKEGPYKGKYRIQTKFGIFDHLYSACELHAVLLVDQEAFKPQFQFAPSRKISLSAVAKKVKTNNKVAFTYSCKKLCNPRS